jgi:hypothetical protein
LLHCKQNTSHSFPPNQASVTLTVSFLANNAADGPADSVATDSRLRRDGPDTDLLPAKTSHRGGPGSVSGQFMWGFWRTKWHWNSFFSSTSVFPCQYHSTTSPYSFTCHLPYIILVTDSVVKQTQFLGTTDSRAENILTQWGSSNGSKNNGITKIYAIRTYRQKYTVR